MEDNSIIIWQSILLKVSLFSWLRYVNYAPCVGETVDTFSVLPRAALRSKEEQVYCIALFSQLPFKFDVAERYCEASGGRSAVRHYVCGISALPLCWQRYADELTSTPTSHKPHAKHTVYQDAHRDHPSPASVLVLVFRLKPELIYSLLPCQPQLVSHNVHN